MDTKYKTVDRTVRSVAAPLLEDNWDRMKMVVEDPSLRDPIAIGY